MAQTCGVYAGLQGKQQGLPVRLGFLLGTRNFNVSRAWFRQGESLIINACEIMTHEMMGVFDCKIICNDEEISTAQLSVYQPEDPLNIIGKP